MYTTPLRFTADLDIVPFSAVHAMSPAGTEELWGVLEGTSNFYLDPIVDFDGKVFVGTSDGGLLRLDAAGTLEAVTLPPQPHSGAFIGFGAHSELYLLGDGGIWQLSA